MEWGAPKAAGNHTESEPRSLHAKIRQPVMEWNSLLTGPVAGPSEPFKILINR